jgi:hypothetical protein
MKNIQARISYKVEKSPVSYKASMKQWLTKKIMFERINYAKFTKEMVLAVVEFDKDNCIYVLVPEAVFKKVKTQNE